MRTAFITTHLRRWHFSWLLILMCLIVPSAGQQSKDDRKFRSVPKQLRQRLIERFNLYMEYEQTQQYEKLFDLLSQADISNQNLTKRQYPEYRSSSRLIEFKLRTVSRSMVKENADEYEITGMATFQRGENMFGEEAFLKARWQDDDWYFSDWLIRIED